MSFLNIHNLYKKDERGFELGTINFAQNPLQKIAIAGETGSGKTTLLKIIAGLVQPDAGTVLFKGNRVKGPLEELVPGCPGIAYLSQQFELPNFLSVEQILIYSNPLLDAEAEKDETAKALYKLCRIDHLLKRRTDQLSGGEKQRVALAKLLVSKPKLLLLDEPFSNLDMVHKNTLKSVIKDIGKSLSISFIMVSHDPLDTLSWADEILVMQEGKIIQKATPQKVYNQPANAYVAGLFGKYNAISPVLAKAFSNAAATTFAEEKWLIRPENFIISTNDDQSLKSEVTNVLFFGSYYEVEVLLLNESIIIKTNNSIICKGDFVYIQTKNNADLYR